MPSQLLSPKRKAIADSNKAMFLWIAGMSVVVGICIVVMIFLGQQIAFKVKVVAALGGTVSDINHNNDVANELMENVRVLESNDALRSVRIGDEKALQVPLDALPADRNAIALGASLQEVLLTGVSGLEVVSLAVDSDGAVGQADGGETEGGEGADSGSSVDSITIQMQLKAGSANTIKDALTRLERSIRVIDIDTFSLERSDSTYEVSITAHAYYELAQELQLVKQTIMPGGKK